MKEKKEFGVDIPVYRRKCMVYIGFSYDEMQAAIKKKFDVSIGGLEKDTHQGAVFTLENKKSGLKCLCFWCEFPGDLENFSHEVFHLTATIMTDADVKFCEDSEEAWAYLYGYLFSKLKMGR